MLKKYVDNRPTSACVDVEGKLTRNAFLTSRLFTIEKVEVQALAGYIEGGGLKGNNLRTLEHVDHQTRGGADLFIWALDANITPSPWEDYKADGESVTWLDKMKAEIVTVTNSSFTCMAGKGAKGGTLIDYFIISKALLPLIKWILAVMDAPWSPHFGLELGLNAKPSEILLRILVKPAMP